MFSLKSIVQNSGLGRLVSNTAVKFENISVRLENICVASLSTSHVTRDDKVGSTWRLPRYEGKPAACWPHYVKHYTHPK